eukprot:Plantae.Rhodophyta-Hildenbrandia_rubra.ctg33496.p1 GENE.Plantae.Rhodophyta-Hildenbrandia_rubra.ctg33496~~Plantae.Rhodophyta-Hildenbrandia_rubra.ctg33496.p1  ORF type:complete len:137 (-),score=37.94 Plantae.Rhodophyta-Hildenbrandia_rubra.ctg33496:513-923(-)
MSERMQGKPGGDKAPVLKDGQGFDTSWIPEFLQPGVGHAMRAALHAILLILNALLLYCAVKGTLRPHFEIMFVMSSILTGLYSWFILQLEKTENKDREAIEKEAVEKATKKIEKVRREWEQGKKGKKRNKASKKEN